MVVVGIGQRREVQFAEEARQPQAGNHLDALLVVGYLAVAVGHHHVPLHADGRDGQSLVDERTEKVAHTLDFRRHIHGVVVVVELDAGVGLVGILESQGDVVLTQNLVEHAAAECAIILEGLVHHVPSLNASLEVRHHGGDVLLHALLERLAVHGLPLLVHEEPGSALGVPDETVAQHVETIPPCLIHELVGQGEVIDALLGMYDLAFHHVFGHHIVVLLHYLGPVGRLVVLHTARVVASVPLSGLCLHLPLVHAHARAPVFAVRLLEGLCLSVQERYSQHHGCK